ncbi:MAG: hypothetical protein EOO62_21480 [Hymenobacter sp.]|nr:MAG: hypothetical protein EOO62_21480 [Hymenobacter sp.]
MAEAPLNGVYEVAPRAEFSWASLINGTFQPALESYLEDRIGFRSWLIRLRNQLGYSVFNESWANHIAVGRHKVLFPPEDLDAYLGTEYVGDQQVQFDARLARVVQDTLARHGVQIVYVLAPGKTNLMPENMPWHYRQQHPALTNYRAYAAALPAAGVHVLDLDRVFRQWKSTSPYPLFTPGGMHWSTYGAARAADTLQHYLRQTLHINGAPFTVSAPELSTTARDTDDDLARTLNVFAVAPPGVLAYPKLEFLPPPTPAPAKPNVLLVADSFGWGLISNQYMGSAFSPDSRYWYYNSQVAWPGPEQTPDGRDIFVVRTQKDQYLKRNLIIVMYYPRNLNGFDRSFSYGIFKLFTPYTTAEKTQREVLLSNLHDKASWAASAKADFEQHLNDTVDLIMNRQRILGRAAQR